MIQIHNSLYVIYRNNMAYYVVLLNLSGRELEGGGLFIYLFFLTASRESNRGQWLKSANELGEFPSKNWKPGRR